MKLCEIQLNQSARTLWMEMGTHGVPGVFLCARQLLVGASGLLLEAQRLQRAFTERTV